MDEDESRSEARPSTPALKKNNHDPTDGDSYVGDSSDAHIDGDSITTEQHLRAHLLQDTESSFVPPISPIRVAGPEGGLDDTYLFDSTTAARKPLPLSPLSHSPGFEGDDGHGKQQSGCRISPTSDGPQQSRHPPLLEASGHHDYSTASRPAETVDRPDVSQADASIPTHAYFRTSEQDQSDFDDQWQTPSHNTSRVTLPSSHTPSLPPESQADDSLNGTDGDVTNTTASLENMSSSPTAAAVARTVSRAISMTGRPSASIDDYSTSDADPSRYRDSSILAIPATEHSFSAATPSSQDHNSGFDLGKASTDAGSTPGAALKFGSRPKYLRSRHASQRSSTSSFLASEDGHSDVTVGLGVDYAIQSGGSIPTSGVQRNHSNSLLRSISMGSIASGFDDFPDSSKGIRSLEPLEEMDGSPEVTNREHRNEDDFVTPKAKKTNGLLAPTDTVIARHVHNVEVPDSLAREYKTKGGLETPTQPFRKMVEFTPAPGTAAKNGRNLTLKEQSSTIERLSKENFDLKLKVMFLSDRLDKLSEEGIKEMIQENVELKTKAAVLARDNKVLRKRVKELERNIGGESTRPSTARSGYSSDGQPASPFDHGAQEREEELLYLRERIEDYITEIEHLKSENMAQHAEKRRLADVVKNMGDRAGERAGDSLGRQEEADVYKDLLEQETARREQADDDNRRLRDEVFRLKQEVNFVAAGGSAVSGSGTGGMHHTTNIYNITRKVPPTSPSRVRPVSGLSGDVDGGSVSQTTTLVDELRRETDQLRHENAELRREVGAQTSMLTSRNREKERLYQEIEDLKLAQRRGGALSTIDSLLDRSASRAGIHERSQSRGSARTRLTMAVEDPNREEFENKLAELRDKVSELKMQNQELQLELESCMRDFETAANAKIEATEDAKGLQEELDNALADLMAIQSERDEALQDQSHLESEFEVLRKEAQEEIDALEAEADTRNDEIQRLQLDVQDRSENFHALQEEMRTMSEALIHLEDEQDNKHRRIEELESEAADNNRELEELEAKLLEAHEKIQRLGVQQESSQGEIAFLREEQEADKVKIGELEAALASVQQNLREERDRAKELGQHLSEERQQREIIATQEKEDIQHFVNDLNKQLSAAKTDARQKRKELHSRELEATEWKERLMELENNLREALGDLNGTRSSLLKSIAKLQRELENTIRELDTTKAAILEKDRIIKQRDALLESHGLESKKLAELLDKERLAHRNIKNSYETFQRTNSHVSRTVSSQDGRIMELETTRAVDKRKMAQLEANFKDQLTQRNNLLLILWTKLSALCGTDWAHNHSLIDGRALPSLEAVTTMLPGFSKNLLSAIKTIEALVGGYQSRISAVEKDLWKEYQALENNLEVRTKKLDRLETIVRNGSATGDFNTMAKISQLEAAVRALKIENATLMRANDAKTRAVGGYFDWRGEGGGGEGDEFGSPSPSVPTGPIRRGHNDPEGERERRSGISRSKTTHLEATSASTSSSLKSRTNTISRSSSTHTQQPSDVERASASTNSEGDTKWMLRLRELEYKLKQEREARNMDRAAARQRISEGERQKDELVAELVRANKRKGGE